MSLRPTFARIPSLSSLRSSLSSPLRTVLLTRRCLTTLPRPYTFHIGLAYARKPPDASQPEHYRRAPSKSFARLSDKGLWRDAVLREWAGGDVGRNSNSNSEPFPGMLREEREDNEHAMGEDFLFVQPMQGQSGVAIGIADGVGGWSASGVDPSLFSQSMMFHSSAAAAEAWAFPPDVDPPSESDSDSDSASGEVKEVLLRGEGWEAREKIAVPPEGKGKGEGEELGPEEILQRGYDAVLSDGDVEMGASTACVLTLNSKTGKLRAANLGDSGFLVLRGPSIQHIQRAQTHYFNCPKQLSKYPKQAFKKGNRPILDKPADADVWECTLRHGDVVLLYTDGLSDNIFASHMLELSLLSQSYSPSRSGAGAAAGDEASLASESEPGVEAAESLQAKRLARMCVEHARKAMVDVGVLTPFELSAKSEGGWEWWDWIGGKIDDVTVIAVVVTEGM
ncbi:hypothetical protein CALVIDRAFT_541634 [Calocera viscosa TUFC12733]|uniref:Protein phosphatase n=1 Tax=Calocera viscosa (strain TUFC12733) TaxID=1330018 RepID=A0A167HKT2_CALVF|nr:hypothetical protein CALVIDRAFT_541634 [Calocera viscosa TUFC12733]